MVSAQKDRSERTLSQARNEYYLLLEGETSGPHTLEELHQLWLAEKITLDTLYVEPGMHECKPVNLILNRVIAFQKVEPKALMPVIETLSPKSFALLWGTAAVGIGLLLWTILSPSLTTPNLLHPRFEATTTHLTIQNRNDFEWKNITVSLNGEPPAGYDLKITRLPSGQSIRVPFTDFKNERRRPFEAMSMTIEAVWVGDGRQGYRSYNLRGRQ